MLKAILISTILTSFISLGYQQDPDIFGNRPTNVAERVLPPQAMQIAQGNFYSKPGRNVIRSIPCRRRSFQNVPTYNSRFTLPLLPNDNINMLPQSLTEVDSNLENSILKATNNHNQGLDPSAAPNMHDNYNEFKPRNSLLVNNDDLMEASFSRNSGDFRDPSSLIDNENAIVENREVEKKNEVPLSDLTQARGDTNAFDTNYQNLLPNSETTQSLKSDTNKDVADADVSNEEAKELNDDCNKNRFKPSVNLNDQSRRFISTPDEIPESTIGTSQPKANPMKSKQIHVPSTLTSGLLDIQKGRKTDKHTKEDYNDADTDMSLRSQFSSENVKAKPINQISKPVTYRISDMEESRGILMQSSRVCYACSTANNPTCREPDRRTTVKYCRQGHTACITKVFQTPFSDILIRDCNNSCNESDFNGLMPKYKSCSICHTDLCNSAYSVSCHNVMLAVFLISVAKYFL